MKEAIDEFLSFLKEDNSYDRKRYHRTHISSNDSCGSRDHNRYDEDPNGEYAYLDNNPDGSCSVPRDKYILRDKYLANKDTYDAQYPRTPTDWAGYEFPHNDNETDSSLQTVKEFLKTAKPRLHESCDAHGGCGMWYDDKEKQVEEPHSCCEGMPIC